MRHISIRQLNTLHFRRFLNIPFPPTSHSLNSDQLQINRPNPRLRMLNCQIPSERLVNLT